MPWYRTACRPNPIFRPRPRLRPALAARRSGGAQVDRAGRPARTGLSHRRDPAAVYTLRTEQGDGYVDQASGALLSYRAHSATREAF
ncbi:hypothetical protein LP420_40965 [Massilia sp. B-10]|nr:hypothetical protein LP420_40965 [Massilia sp. B-10]